MCLWKTSKNKKYLEWQFLFPRWINLEMDAIIKKMTLILCFAITFVCLILPYSHQLFTILLSCFVSIWIYGICKDSNNIDVTMLMNQYLIEHHNNIIPNYQIFLQYVYLYWLKISPQFIFISFQAPIKNCLQFVTAMWFNDCYQQNVNMYAQYI